MAEASRSQVTITLGSTGQVVKRAGPMMDGAFLESPPATGSKRSVKDRLGSNVDSLMHENPLNNKRQRGDRNKLHLSSNGVNAKGKCIGKDDLRFKIMQKSMSFRAQTNDLLNGMDLREKLSRTVKHAETSVDMQKPRPETKETNPWGQLPSRRSAEDSPQINLPRNSYSAWSLDQLKQRYPDGIFGSTGSLSPQMNVPKLQKRPIIQKYDDVRSAPFIINNILDPPGRMGTTPFMTKSTLPTGSAKPVAPMQAHLQPSSNIVQKNSYIGDEQPTVDSLLHSLGLGKYAIYFKAEEVDMAALKQMGEHDLKELGIPMGPRKKILLAILSRSNRQL
ncbi:uncharacterized protein LOC117924944 isoform X1 [Vitis riparia]|uniref:uncharacterized protein LOC117924944 isoform X1 n=2 Tax=Vitis riparia TaxID=96939 RepID=UPI00155B00C3|nr:uncharacterized protein LOC117924944 isoform X1 [Vitis riparia]